MSTKLEQVQDSFVRVLKELEPFIDADRHSRALQITREGQPGPAFQNICSHLIHAGVSLSPRIYGQIQSIGEWLGFPEHVWIKLNPRERESICGRQQQHTR